MRKFRNNAIAFLAGAFLAGAALCVTAPASGAQRASVHRVIIDKMAFNPAPQNVHAGDTIEWVNNDIFRHSATASDMSFDVDLPPNATGSVVVRTAGTIDYICKYHPGMKGRITVEK